MSGGDHLPEYHGIDQHTEWHDPPLIGDLLVLTKTEHEAAPRACEARVLDGGAWYSDVEVGLVKGDAELRGRRAGLDAARDAVAAIEHWASYSSDGDVWSCWSSDPLAAIDALRVD